ncbi:spore coat protein, partial [archaeon]|nr:spore coat protein [archaeon]
MKKTIALIQARVSSSRLPGKVLMDICGEPMIIRVYQRAKRAGTLDDVVVITSDHQDDDALEELCLEKGVPCFRGNLDDVLDRYYQASVQHHADVIVRITGDCPLLDPGIVDTVVRTFLDGAYDYVSNVLECTYPDGLDTEIFSRTSLEKAWNDAVLKSEREHVTAYIYKHPELFRLGSVMQKEDLSSMR